MPSCIVKGCKYRSSTRSSHTLLTMHVFPRELGRIKLWLQHTGQDFGDIDAFAGKILDAAKSGKYRLCSAHFDPTCYTMAGCRLVLKHDAVPTVFPGVYPKPSRSWKSVSPQVSKAQLEATRTRPSASHEKVHVVKLLRKDAATQTNVSQDKARPTALNTSLMERCNQQEDIFDASGRLIGVFSPDTRQRDLKVRPGLWTYDWSTQVSKEPYRKHPPMENKEALSSLEKVLLSLLKHMADAPHSRPQKQRTKRLLNRTAEIISILTGEEWTVVKKNAHISKFYQMIREVPIKCGDVAMFFTRDEWEYIEEHEDLYKLAMLENPKNDKTTEPPCTGAGGSQDPEGREQTSANTDHGAGKRGTSEISRPPPHSSLPHSSPFPSLPLPPYPHPLLPPPSSLPPHPPLSFLLPHSPPLHDRCRMPASPTPDCKVLGNISDTRSIPPERPEQCRSSISDSLTFTSTHAEPPLKEEEEAGTSCRRSFTCDTHHTEKDEEFIKKEDKYAEVAENSTAEIVHRCSTRNDSHQSHRSDLWIAENGTTSSGFSSQELIRPPRIHKTYSRKPKFLHRPLRLPCDSPVAPDSFGSDQTSIIRGSPRLEHCCEECNGQFTDKCHQKLHPKIPSR